MHLYTIDESKYTCCCFKNIHISEIISFLGFSDAHKHVLSDRALIGLFSWKRKTSSTDVHLKIIPVVYFSTIT